MSKKVTSKIAETPLMKQFNQIKAKHPDAILLFRVGDFYETFGEDAKKASTTGLIVLQGPHQEAPNLSITKPGFFSNNFVK